MKVMLIPSSVGTNREDCQFLTSFLINDSIALDAGSVGYYQTPFDQSLVRHILLSHSHIDHIGSLPIFVENAYEGKTECVTIHASEPVLECLQKDIFNDRVWPDFIALSRQQAKAPFLKLQTVRPGQVFELEGLRITPVPVHHVVPTLGFIVEDGSSAVVFPGDTGPTDEIWEAAGKLANLKAVFLEATFPNALAWLADVAQHHTPASFAADMAKLKKPAAFIAVHIKARYHAQVVAELQALNLPNLSIGVMGKPYVF